MNIIYIGTLHPHPGGSAISGSQIVENLAKGKNEVVAIGPITSADLPEVASINELIPGVDVRRYEVPYYNTSTHDTHSEEYAANEVQSIQRLFASLKREFAPDIIFLGRETFAPLIPHFRKYAPIVLRVAGATTLGIANSAFPVELANQYLREYGSADLLISPAKHTAKFLMKKGLAHCVHIPNAVNTTKFSKLRVNSDLRNQLQVSPNELIVAHISGLESIKRPMDFMKAAEILSKSKERLVFMVVGNGPCYTEMYSFAKEHGFLEKCRFVGWIDYDKVEEYFQASDIIVMPCEADTQPRVYLESMASGKVLIASKIPASTEVIKHGVTGFLYEKGMIRDLANCIESCANVEKLRESIGTAARAYVEANHSWRSTIAEYQRQFQKILIQQHES